MNVFVCRARNDCEYLVSKYVKWQEVILAMVEVAATAAEAQCEFLESTYVRRHKVKVAVGTII